MLSGNFHLGGNSELRGPEGPERELNRPALGFSKTRVVPLWHQQHFKKAAKAKQQQNWPSARLGARGVARTFFRVYVIIITVTLTLRFRLRYRSGRYDFVYVTSTQSYVTVADVKPADFGPWPSLPSFV